MILRPRFFPVSDAWTKTLSAKIKSVAKAESITLHEGVYVAFRGPSSRRRPNPHGASLGCGAVGMSSVPDGLIAPGIAAKSGRRTCITNRGRACPMKTCRMRHAGERFSRCRRV